MIPLHRRGGAIDPTYRYGVLLVLLFATFVFMASGVTGDWARLVVIFLQGGTLLAACAATGAHRRLVRVVVVLTTVAVVAVLGSLLLATSRQGQGVAFALNSLLVSAAPVIIARSLLRRRVVDVQTVLGAVCIYVLIGMLAAFVYGAIANLSSGGFFVQTKHADPADFLYFSFVTLTTVGYGDLTAAGHVGRAFAVLVSKLSGIRGRATD